jgi:hypothetical protein
MKHFCSDLVKKFFKLHKCPGKGGMSTPSPLPPGPSPLLEAESHAAAIAAMEGMQFGRPIDVLPGKIPGPPCHAMYGFDAFYLRSWN